MHTRYLHKDHLGSIDSITDESGKLVEKLYFDAWGKKQSIDRGQWSVNEAFVGLSLGNILALTPRGFTGHEHVDHADIIHMNGRIYDPTLGRFLQADPFIQAPKNSQSLNRYSYVLNNPLSYTDPSGYFLSTLWGAGKAIFNKIAKPILQAISQNQYLNMVAYALASYYGGPMGASAYASATTYANTGSLSAAFTSGAIAYATAWVGGQAGLSGGEQFLASGFVGGVGSVLQGGKFGHGFISAGLGSLGGGSNAFARVAISSVIGGTISKITGGKFANGAKTAAFAALLSEATRAYGNRPLEEGSAEFEAREEAYFQDEHKEMMDALHSGHDLLAANFDWLEPYTPSSIFDNAFSQNALQCRTTCIDRYYGDSYYMAEELGELWYLKLGVSEAFKYSAETLEAKANRNLWGDSRTRNFKPGQRMLQTLKQARFASGAMAVVSAGASGYVWGARGYCTYVCLGQNGE